MNLTIKERIDIIKTGSIPDGYKRCKTGTIPKDWDEKRIVEICNVNKQSLNGSTPKDYLFNYYDLSSIDNGKIMHPPNQIRFEEAPSRARRIFKKNDILMSTVRPYLKGFAYIDFDCRDCIASTGFAILESKNDKDAMLIYHNLFSYAIDKQINSLLVGSNYPAINSSDVENLKIPYAHNACEREIIGNILTTCDKAIKLKERLIEEKKKQKTGLMQKLLTGNVRFTGFNDAWEEVKFGKVFKFLNKERVSEPQNYKLLTVKLHLKGIEATEKYPNDTKNGRPYYLREPNEILIGRQNYHNGGIGIVPSNMKNYIASNAISSLTTIKGDLMFLFYYISNVDFYKRVGHMIGGTGQKEISETTMKNLVLRIPKSLEEQKKIGEVLKTADNEIDLLEKELESLKQQKKGLMQLLLTGIIRVNTQENEKR